MSELFPKCVQRIMKEVADRMIARKVIREPKWYDWLFPWRALRWQKEALAVIASLVVKIEPYADPMNELRDLANGTHPTMQGYKD